MIGPAPPLSRCTLKLHQDMRDGLPVWGGVLDSRGIKGRGPRLPFDIKRALPNIKKMEPEKLELESTHPETLAIYTHTLKRSGWFFLLTTNTTALFFISIYLHSYGCHTTRLPQGIKIVECFLSFFNFYTLAKTSFLLKSYPFVS